MGRFMTLSANVSASNFPNTRVVKCLRFIAKFPELPAVQKFFIALEILSTPPVLQHANSALELETGEEVQKLSSYIKSQRGSLEDEGAIIYILKRSTRGKSCPRKPKIDVPWV